MAWRELAAEPEPALSQPKALGHLTFDEILAWNEARTGEEGV
jgi:hypothetical protein